MLRTLSIAIVLAAFGLSGHALAQTRCEPTLTQPCTTPQPTRAPATRTTPPQPQPPSRIEDAPLFPPVKLNSDTTMGIGIGEGFGVKREF